MLLVDGQQKNGGLRTPALFLTVLLPVVMWGCSDRDPLSGVKFYPVKGKVTHPDGKTMSGLKVNFWGPTNDLAHDRERRYIRVQGNERGPSRGRVQGEPRDRLLGEGLQERDTAVPQPLSRRGFFRAKGEVTADGPNDFDYKLTMDRRYGGSRGSGNGRGKAHN